MSTHQAAVHATIGRPLPVTGRVTPVLQPDPGSFLDPGIFAHGRLLRRFNGSDAFRFSSRSALNILGHVGTPAESGPHVLWDPFCGTGLIPCVGLFACARSFDVVIASDIEPEAVRCARGNMRLLCDSDAFDERLRELRARQNANAKEQRRWGEVAAYMERIRPVLDSQWSFLPPIHGFVSSAFALPGGVGGRVHFVADLPYGKTSALKGGELHDVIPAILRVYPEATIAFVLPRAALGEIRVADLPALQCRPLKGGRVIVRV